MWLNIPRIYGIKLGAVCGILTSHLKDVIRVGLEYDFNLKGISVIYIRSTVTATLIYHITLNEFSKCVA